MANPKHLALLNTGVEALNHGREEKRQMRPDLRSAAPLTAAISATGKTTTPIGKAFQRLLHDLKASSRS